MMKDGTVRQILADPEFDPSFLLEPALLNYMSKNPSSVASDKVAMKWLAKDETVIRGIASLVNPNNTSVLADAVASIGRMDTSWAKSDAAHNLCISIEKCAVNGGFDDIARVAEIVCYSSVTSKVEDLPIFVSLIAPQYREAMLEKAIESGYSIGFEVKSWNTLMDWQSTKMVKMFAKAFEECKVKITDEVLRYMSGVFKTRPKIYSDEGAIAVCQAIKNRWPSSFVCFRCGQGSEFVDSSRDRRRRRSAVPRRITSPSGFTLHKKKCDPNNEYPSPWESHFMVRRDLEFQCQYCGRECTSPSGLTLHEKKCV
jgi:hypothetical protein